MKLIAGEWSDSLEALVLVGSFSRGEGITWQDNGRLRFLSDIEFWAVVEFNEFNELRVQRVIGKK